MNRTVDTLVKAVYLDDERVLSPAAIIDFGLDLNPSLFGVYQRALKTEQVTAKQLHNAAGNGESLSLLIGDKVHTMWDDLQSERDCWNDEVGDP